MRELKFRAWDRGTNAWHIFVPEMSIMCDPIDRYVLNTDNGLIIWEQYTGLKDKNVMDIFEGDIIEWANAPGMIDTAGVVFFNVKRGCWFVENDADNIYDALYNVFDYSIVIGNIHKNPELLNE